MTKLFDFSRNTIFTHVEMLTAVQSRLLSETAETKYGVKVSNNQIINLPLSKFECSLLLFDEAGNKYLLKGGVLDFKHFPLRMDFHAPLGSRERKLFDEYLSEEDDSGLEFTCNMESMGKRKFTNSLTITLDEIEHIGLEEKLLGPSHNAKATVFVTRHQMTSLAAEMYSTLNIVEEYQMPETQFSEAFIEGMISQAAVNAFSMVSIDTAVATS